MSQLSCDTNILLHALNSDSKFHQGAVKFLAAQGDRFVLCELVLVELYVLLRNPAVLRTPLDAARAVEVCARLRTNPAWALLDYPGPAAAVMDQVWKASSARQFGRRRIFDARLAFTLRHYGVAEFATQNVRDFEGFGLRRVFDPLS